MPIYNNILAGSSGQGGYEIKQSLRVDGYPGTTQQILTRSPSSSGNRRTFTISFWWKPSLFNKAEDDYVIKVKPNNDNQFMFNKKAGADNISIVTEVSTSIKTLATTRVFRDPNWYHFVIAVDTTQATAANRIKLYVNGVQETDFSTEQYPDQNWELPYNQSGVNQDLIYSREDLGRSPSGYFAEWHSIDGTALDASYFGETNSDTNQWVPIKYAGSYGTNGFYLNFSDSASLGADSSGNGNNFTPTNLAATDQVLDSPTNNFATLNLLSKEFSYAASDSITLSEGSLKFDATLGGETNSTFGVLSGKWYAEFYAATAMYPMLCGVKKSGTIKLNDYPRVHIDSGGTIRNNGVQTQDPSPDFAVGDIFGVALDMDAGSVQFYRNNSVWGSSESLSSATEPMSFFVGNGTTATRTIYANFGQDSSFAGTKTAQNNTDGNGKGDFYYAPPSGYLALCEDNLPDPSIALPGEHFNTVLYTGLYGTSDSYTGVGFQPDFTWLKHRNNPTAYGHQLYDVVRGATNYLISNTSGAENDGGGPFTAGLQSFDSDGFTIGQTLTINASGVNHVAWNWKADNTSGSSNTDGTITSTVSANTTAGFSIVSYTGNATAGATVGHGLSQAPEFMLIKQRDATKNWSVFANDPTDYLILNGSNASADDNRFWNDTSPGSSVFTLGSIDWVNATGNTYIAYCFHSVEGYSKFGTYIGNGANNGPFVYTGFSPAFLIVKEINTGVQNWYMMDNKRGTNNPVNQYLYPNQPSAENGYAQGDVFDIVDFVSNGFKIKHSRPALNQSGNTLIYMAFAESPFKYSNAR